MKNIVNHFQFVIILLFLISACKSPSDNKLFKVDREWTYSVVSYNKTGNVNDSLTLILKVTNSWWYENFVGQTRINWVYKRNDKVLKSEFTGVIDENKQISLHPPRELFLNFTEILPFPASGNPGYLNFESKTDMFISKYEDYKDGILEGKTITQYLHAVDRIKYNFKYNNIMCWVLEGENTNYIDELGRFKCRYLFNEELGFVNLIYYKPDSSIVEIKLKSINF